MTTIDIEKKLIMKKNYQNIKKKGKLLIAK